jgi:hypothetical protein
MFAGFLMHHKTHVLKQQETTADLFPLWLFVLTLLCIYYTF